MAETTVAACPDCDKKFKVRAELQGKKIRCPTCKATFVVQHVAIDRGSAGPTDQIRPAQPPSKAAAQPATKPAAKPATLDDDDDDPNPYGVTHVDLTPRCPHCANELPSVDALICLYCGYNTQSRSLGSTRKVHALSGAEHFAHLLPGLLGLFFIIFFIVLHLLYCFVVPGLVSDSWMFWVDHESLRLWAATIFLGIIWGLGIFTYKRLIIEPKPREKLKD